MLLQNNSFHTKEPFQATPGSPGYDFFAAYSKGIFAKSVNVVSTELNVEIPMGYFGKLHPRSSLISNCFVTNDGGVIDSDFRGVLKIKMINHSSDGFHVNLGERVAEIIFQKKTVLTLSKLTSLI